jgi:hypothetical protein
VQFPEVPMPAGIEAGKMHSRDPELALRSAPTGDIGARLVHALEPAPVEALVSDLPSKPSMYAVLDGPRRLDRDVLDAMLLRPSDEGRLVNSGPLSVRTVAAYPRKSWTAFLAEQADPLALAASQSRPSAG